MGKNLISSAADIVLGIWVLFFAGILLALACTAVVDWLGALR